MDMDGDGRISLEEFITFMENNHQDIDERYNTMVSLRQSVAAENMHAVMETDEEEEEDEVESRDFKEKGETPPT